MITKKWRICQFNNPPLPLLVSLSLPRTTSQIHRISNGMLKIYINADNKRSRVVKKKLSSKMRRKRLWRFDSSSSTQKNVRGIELVEKPIESREQFSKSHFFCPLLCACLFPPIHVQVSASRWPFVEPERREVGCMAWNCAKQECNLWC